MVLRNWTLSGVASIRGGLPLNITITRPTTVMADGNNTNQQPNLVPGVSIIPPGGQTISTIKLHVRRRSGGLPQYW